MKRIVLGLLAAAVLCGTKDAKAQEYQIVVNAGTSISEMSKDELSKIFQKKARKLPSGENAMPVDQEKDALVREAFSNAILGRSPSQMESFWQQQIFSGKDVPPAKRKSDAEVIEFVSANPGAIGYVSASASLGDGVRALAVSE